MREGWRPSTNLAERIAIPAHTHSLYAHFVNMLLAMGLSTLAGGGLDECAW